MNGDIAAHRRQPLGKCSPETPPGSRDQRNLTRQWFLQVISPEGFSVTLFLPHRESRPTDSCKTRPPSRQERRCILWL
jgi:hypothetical protein